MDFQRRNVRIVITINITIPKIRADTQHCRTADSRHSRQYQEKWLAMENITYNQ